MKHLIEWAKANPFFTFIIVLMTIAAAADGCQSLVQALK